MDSLTHALVAVVLFYAPFPGQAVLFAILGATLPDIDILLKRFSDRDPGLFVFSHGGFTHSIPGILAVSAGIVIGFLLCLNLGGHVEGLSYVFMAFAFACAGGVTHVLLDVLAFPGIPLLYPLTSKKFTAGIFAGPSLVFLGVSLGLFLLFLSGYPVLPALPVIAVCGGVYILAHVLLKVYVSFTHKGITIPTFNPLKWLVIQGSSSAYTVYRTGLMAGDGKMIVYPRYDGVNPEFIHRHMNDPELQRLAYYSYIMVAGSEGDVVVIRDPLREDGVLFYPPAFTRVRISKE